MHDFDDAHRLAHLLWEVSARSSALTDDALGGLPLTAASAGVLDAVAAQPGASIAELTRRFPTTAQAIAQIVSRLCKLGYLERRARPSGRGIALFLTTGGEQAQHAANDRLLALDAILRATLGDDDHDSLVGLLTRARSALAQLSTTRTEPPGPGRKWQAAPHDRGVGQASTYEPPVAQGPGDGRSESRKNLSNERRLRRGSGG